MPWQIILGMAVCAVVVGLCLWAAYELGCEDGSRSGTTEGATALPPPRARAQDPDTLPGLVRREALAEEQLAGAQGVGEARGRGRRGVRELHQLLSFVWRNVWVLFV
jgi:hypothetical protein